MELFQEIFMQAVMGGKIKIAFHSGEQTVAEVMENICYQTLSKIRDIVRDDSLSDEECFMQIEEIICAFEEMGADCGSRHDFG